MNILFYVRMEEENQIGLYELYFHNCENLGPQEANVKSARAAFTAHIIERNMDSYLSAGDMALPMMYGIISAMFFLIGCIWLRLICTTQEKVFKIHYLMAAIIFVKGLSVMFHSLDYYFIAKDGRTEAWAVIYYIVHLLKGILLIICLLLIGTGWAFIKYLLSDRDKKLFMIVIPMQVMVNVAYIIMEETEEGNKSYYTWKNIVILVDILCCGAILVPVVWSIRHLQEASQTDGKAAMNLAKLELFRHFYILVVCYLYFTRIIVYLLEITLPFQLIWVHALFSEAGAFIFFAITGYKFRPGCDNPYLKLDQYDSDEDPEEAITQSGATENITRVNQRDKDVDETDEFDILLPKQRTTKV
uniref:protein GPR107-like n=1 Tax=Styela clava TaxID=7725 RepID=UPI001939DD22|nr:protein GPR107-like [Styela clava]